MSYVQIKRKADSREDWKVAANQYFWIERKYFSKQIS